MEQFEQYEVWELHSSRWRFVASFSDFAIANELARRRTYRARLIHAVYEGAQRVREDILVELGATRQSE